MGGSRQHFYNGKQMERISEQEWVIWEGLMYVSSRENMGGGAGHCVEGNICRIHCKENPISVFLFWELHGLSPNFHIHVPVSDSQDWYT
jgi:hypothetical protein